MRGRYQNITRAGGQYDIRRHICDITLSKRLNVICDMDIIVRIVYYSGGYAEDIKISRGLEDNMLSGGKSVISRFLGN